MNIPQKLKTKIFICSAIFLITLVLSVVNFITLPDTVAVQWSEGKATNFMSKFEAAVLPLGITLLCTFIWLLCEQNLIAKNLLKGMSEKTVFCFGILLSCIGIILNIILFVMN